MLANWPPVEPGKYSLRELLNELYERGIFPPTDVYVNESEVTVEVALAGVKPSDVQVTATSTTVTIRGERKAELDKGQPYMEGIRRGDFHPTLTLPTPVNPNQAEASFHHGMLIITLPKVAAEKSQVIPIRGDQEQEKKQPVTAT